MKSIRIKSFKFPFQNKKSFKFNEYRGKVRGHDYVKIFKQIIGMLITMNFYIHCIN